MLRYSVKLILLCLMCCQNLVAQDIHFSQFGATPLNYNPAQTGQFDGDFRAGLAERHQWRSVTVPFQTFQAFFDAKQWIKPTGTHVGASIFHDISGDSKFSSLSGTMHLGQSIHFKNDSTWQLNAGLEFGFVQRSIDFNQLYFDQQYNGYIYDPNAAHNESLANLGYSFLRSGIGLSALKQFSDGKELRVGTSAYNLLQSDQTFYTANDVLLDRRWNAHAHALIPVNDQWDALPEILFSQQGKYREFIAGFAMRRNLSSHSTINKAVRGGIWTRSRDAAFINLGMDWGQWYGGISYDVNVSTLRPASQWRGGIEIVLIYTWRKIPPIQFKQSCKGYL